MTTAADAALAIPAVHADAAVASADAAMAPADAVVTAAGGSARADAGITRGHADAATAAPIVGSAETSAGVAVPPGAGSGAPTYFTLPPADIPDRGTFDFTAHLPAMQALAHRVFPDARLVHIGGPGLRPDGTYDLTDPSHNVAYTFRSDAHSKHGALRGETFECLVYVTPSSRGIQVMAASSACDEPFFQPKCTGKMIWDRARAQGAPDMLAGLFLYQYGDGPRWRLAADKYYDVRDADCAH